jgi:hypothetical protein
MTVNQISKKSIPLFLATWIRLFIGSGIEVLRKVKFFIKPEAYIQKMPASEWAFPISYWICKNEKIYCMTSEHGKQEVTIHELPRLGNN